MIRKRKLLVISLIFITLFVFCIGYFMSVLTKSQSEVRHFIDATFTYEQRILENLYHLPEIYKIKQLYNDNLSDGFISNVRSISKINNLSNLWEDTNQGVSKHKLYTLNDGNLGNILYAMNHSKIVKADLDTRGTQLKLLLTLEGDQIVVFKPKWYDKERIIEGPVYAGKDRHSSEILAFYLSAFLNKPIVPMSVERKIKVQIEILPVASKQLLKYSYDRKNRTCIYGQCFYCKKEDPICEDSSGYLTGAVIFNVGASLKSQRSPWQRTYKNSKRAAWETKNDFCKTLNGKVSRQRLYDLIDTAIFDFLIQNGDRHHYETLDENIVWIDNGKGLGNPFRHHIDILAPLYQCCILRGTTWRKLQSLSGGILGEKLREIPNINNTVSDAHLKAIEDRLLIVFATVEFCRSRNKIAHSLF